MICVCVCVDLPVHPAEGHRGLGGDVRGDGADLQQLPEQPGPGALGQRRVPVSEASGQLGPRPGTAHRLHRRKTDLTSYTAFKFV